MNDHEAIVHEFVEWAALRAETVKADLRAIARLNPDAVATCEPEARRNDEAVASLRALETSTA
jgi:hypothetical protein